MAGGNVRAGLRRGDRAFWRVVWTRISGVRALRASLAVGSAMLACRLFAWSAGAAAIGVFFALLADNGGPYRLRLRTMLLLTLADAAALFGGLTVPAGLGVIAGVTVLTCFALTYGRVLSQTWASLSVFVLVAYFAGLGSGPRPFATALAAAAVLVAGGVWAILLSLAAWPVDPFRPAREAVAACYASLAEFTLTLARPRAPLGEEERETHRRAAHAWQRRQRVLLEAARLALSATTARAPARTVRARSLAVLLETSDQMLARAMRLTELTDLSHGSLPVPAGAYLQALLRACADAQQVIASSLAGQPADGAQAFALEGSARLGSLEQPRRRLGPMRPAALPPALTGLPREEQTAFAEFAVAFDAVYAFWTGAGPRPAHVPAARRAGPADAPGWRDALIENWTLRSANLRHTLRVSLVGLVDVLLMHAVHVDHSFWLPMTSILLLQPYRSGSLRKSIERIVGTVAGGALAAVLAVALPETRAMTGVITLLAGLTVATYTVNYAVYCFFLTPTFVLLALPHAHDWRFAGVRIGLTLAGAAISVAAMTLLWPVRAREELGGLLRRSLAAEAAYLRTVLALWRGSGAAAGAPGLAAARRACGLASNDAEEAIDRIMQEPTLGRLDERERALRTEALTLATYVRRFTQSVTTLAETGRPAPQALARLQTVAARMDAVAAAQPAPASEDAGRGPLLLDAAEEQVMRLERQSQVLERAAATAFGP